MLQRPTRGVVGGDGAGAGDRGPEQQLGRLGLPGQRHRRGEQGDARGAVPSEVPEHVAQKRVVGGESGLRGGEVRRRRRGADPLEVCISRAAALSL